MAQILVAQRGLTPYKPRHLARGDGFGQVFCARRPVPLLAVIPASG